MRLATFNVEHLDMPPRASLPIADRVAVLRPILERLDADILCLQEVNGQKVPGEGRRELIALDQVLDGTQYADRYRCATIAQSGKAGVGDTHNLVVISRYPIVDVREVRHTHVAPIGYVPVTATPEPARKSIAFDRPVLRAVLALPSGQQLIVHNVHFRAALASPVAGQKRSASVWNSASGWAEGLFVSTMKRSAQALDLRLDVDRTLDDQPDALIAVIGDLNAEAYEMPTRILMAGPDETGNPMLASRALHSVADRLPEDQRFTIVHGTRRQMLDSYAVEPKSGATVKRCQHSARHDCRDDGRWCARAPAGIVARANSC
ncbi:MAG: endonuclease/exonuclease/phosphatase family protein [Pseudomonadota bacterium]